MAITTYTDTNVVHAANFASLPAAMTFINSEGGNRTLVLKPGTTYTITSQMSFTGLDNVRIEGNGATIHSTIDGNAIFALDSCDDWFVRNCRFTSTGDTSSTNDAFRADNGCTSLHFIDCEFSYFGNSSFRGIPGADNDDINFINCEFHHMGDGSASSPYGQGIDPSSCIRVKVTGCRFHDNSDSTLGHSIYVSRGGTAEGTQITISNCQVWDENGTSFMIVATGGGSIAAVTITGCTFRNCRQVRVGNCQTAVISGNTFDNSSSSTGIELSSTDRVTIVGNHFYGPGDDTVYDAIQFNDPASNHAMINGNHFEAWRNAVNINTDVDRVSIMCNVAHDCDNFVTFISGNTITEGIIALNAYENVTANGIDLNAGATVLVLFNYQFSAGASPMLDADNVTTLIALRNFGASAGFGGLNLTDGLVEAPLQVYTTNQRGVSTFSAGDTTPSVLGSTYWRTNNSSGTTITAFDDIVRGEVYHVLINDANTTLDFTSSSLKGNNGVDYTCANGDMLQLFYDGSVTHVWISEA